MKTSTGNNQNNSNLGHLFSQIMLASTTFINKLLGLISTKKVASARGMLDV